ncbi:hypothetical protein KSC_068350 [Ktedonobacter sp. SOSP1-52]|nr:hypothetical protein KSC_068350 [Ktedonobacter sp. SOSP1-52]
MYAIAACAGLIREGIYWRNDPPNNEEAEESAETCQEGTNEERSGSGAVCPRIYYRSCCVEPNECAGFSLEVEDMDGDMVSAIEVGMEEAELASSVSGMGRTPL